MNYGAFVRLEGDVDGMVHISQLDPHGERVDSVYNAVEVRGRQHMLFPTHPQPHRLVCMYTVCVCVYSFSVSFSLTCIDIRPYCLLYHMQTVT